MRLVSLIKIFFSIQSDNLDKMIKKYMKKKEI